MSSIPKQENGVAKTPYSKFNLSLRMDSLIQILNHLKHDIKQLTEQLKSNPAMTTLTEMKEVKMRRYKTYAHEFENVFREHEKLLSNYGESRVTIYIEIMDFYDSLPKKNPNVEGKN